MESISVKCSRCHFPISTTGAGQRVSCPFCGETGVIEAITSDRLSRGTGLQARISGTGSTFLALLIGLGVGTAFGPEIMLASKWGRDTIRKKLTEKL